MFIFRLKTVLPFCLRFKSCVAKITLVFHWPKCELLKRVKQTRKPTAVRFEIGQIDYSKIQDIQKQDTFRLF